jgi:cytochrome b6-f complex iron-sulfur subunit
MAALSRRDFLKITSQTFLAASGLLGLGALLRFLGYQTEPLGPTEFDLGPASGYPVGSRTVLSEVPAVLIHSEAGFSALSLVCTHLGCTVEQKTDGFTCLCHGSKFGVEGLPRRGPAEKSLASLHIEQNAQGHLILQVE